MRRHNPLAVASVLLIAAGTLAAAQTAASAASSTTVLTGLRVTGWTNSTIGVAWNAPATGTWTYWIRLDGNTPESRSVTRGSTVTANFAAAPGAHQISVVALDANNRQAVSDRTVPADTRVAFNDTTPPAAPRAVTASAVTATSANGNWDAVTDDGGKVANYQVSDDGGTTWHNAYRSGQLQLYFSPSFQFLGLLPGTRRTLAVRAVDAAGNVSATTSAEVTTTAAADRTPPTAPGRLTVVKDAAGRATALTWDASTDDSGQVVRYRVFEADDPRLGLSRALLTWVTGSSARLDITELVDLCILTPGTTYTVNVRASDPTGNLSSASGTVSFTP